MVPPHSKVIEDDDLSEPEFDPLNPDLKDDEGWEDAEPEEEEQYEFIGLFDSTSFPSLSKLIEHDASKHGFDLTATKKRLKLDLVGTIKLVNYLRTQTKLGSAKVSVNSAEVFSDDKFLQPVLEDDAVLFSLGDLEVDGEEGEGEEDAGLNGISGRAQARIEQLEQELLQARKIISELRAVTQRNFEEGGDVTASPQVEANRKEKSVRENDQSYFKSYSYNDIHETMLKDTVRTDAYRDFIYDNKDLFAGKTVLDVGCGTGILSMMCAKAGAAKVFAVDNSDIINKARANVFENGLADTVTCLHGKIEDISLPVTSVDIIVSEWMGYALLYESMLDSVISARDRYLAPGGLMVPSHSTLFLAPISVADVVTDRVGFWQDVYGFRMPAMLEGIFDEILLRNLGDEDVVGTSSPFLQLSLHTTKVEDTIFSGKPFSLELTKDADPLDGYAIWFDMFFARSPDVKVPLQTRARDWKDGVAFSTGPGKATTHWQQIVLLLDTIKQKEAAKLLAGSKIQGDVSYERRRENERELDISVRWSAVQEGKRSEQKWELV